MKIFNKFRFKINQKFKKLIFNFHWNWTKKSVYKNKTYLITKFFLFVKHDHLDVPWDVINNISFHMCWFSLESNDELICLK